MRLTRRSSNRQAMALWILGMKDRATASNNKAARPRRILGVRVVRLCMLAIILLYDEKILINRPPGKNIQAVF